MRTFIADLPGGTATTTIQTTERGTIRTILLSFLSTAVGKLEVSTAPASQIGTAQPTEDVIARVNCSATAGNVVVAIPVSLSVKPFQNIYVHQTGAGNLGTITLLPS